MDDAYRFNKVAKSFQRFWDSYRQTLSGRGLDLDDLLERWVQAQKVTSHNPQIIPDFDELCAHGCHPSVLALLVVSMKNAAQLVNLWATYVGQPKARRSASKTLEAAASILEEVFAKIIALENDHARRQLKEFDLVPFSILISQLRMYSDLLLLGEILKTGLQTRSPAELARFLLTYYVERATGRPHDRNISSLLTETQNLEAYDEVAQRMWRERNYKRLAKHHQKLGELVFVIGAVVTHQT